MTIPAENKRILRALGRESHYTWERPKFIEPRVNLTSYPGAKYVLERQHDFTVTWGKTTAEVYGPYGARFMLSGDDKIHTTQRETMSKVLYRENWHADVKKFYEHITLQLLHRKSYKIGGINHVDITRE
jgi:linoleate 10R-lipoxygenase